MVSASEARRLALSLPEAVEQDHHGFPSFRVAGKIFATAPDERHLHVMLDEPGIREAVAADPAFEEKWWGSTLSAARVDLDRVDAGVLREALTDAWRRRAPRRLRAALPDPPD